MAELAALDVKLKSQAIVSLSVLGSRLLVSTLGDVLQIDTLFMQPSVTHFHRICYNKKGQRALTVVEPSASLSYVAVGGDEGVVYVYDTKEFALVDVWRIGFGVTTLHAATSSEAGCTLAAGTANGLIYLLNYSDMEDYQLHCSNKKITELKMTESGEFLVAGSEDCHLYLYQLEEEKFVSVATRK